MVHLLPFGSVQEPLLGLGSRFYTNYDGPS